MGNKGKEQSLSWKLSITRRVIGTIIEHQNWEYSPPLPCAHEEGHSTRKWGKTGRGALRYCYTGKITPEKDWNINKLSRTPLPSEACKEYSLDPVPQDMLQGLIHRLHPEAWQKNLRKRGKQRPYQILQPLTLERETLNQGRYTR